MRLNRRELLFAAGAGLLGAPASGRVLAEEQRPPKKVLFFTKSSGFQHSVIARSQDQLGLAERILCGLGKAHGFDVFATKDGRHFEPDRIGEWDAFAFQTTGDLTESGTDKMPPMSRAGKQAFLDAIRSGKGFIGMHCASDTFHSKADALDPYIEMIGGEFIVHGEQQKARIDIADPMFPGVVPFLSSFEILDEWYALKNFQEDLHVILVQNTEEMEKTRGSNTSYDRPSFPETWARLHGKGRVFYTSMGHREDVWECPMYQGMLLGALNWVTGRVEASLEPNLSSVAPGFKELGPYVKK